MYSVQEETSDGTLDRVVLGIDFIDTSHIHVFRSDIETELAVGVDYTWDGDTAINLSVTVPTGVIVTLLRRTLYNAMLNVFSGGAPFTRVVLDENFDQILMIAQEAAESGLTYDYYRNLNLHNRRILNLGSPIADTDAASKIYVDTLRDSLRAGLEAASAGLEAADAALSLRIGALEGRDFTGKVAVSYIAIGGETVISPNYKFMSAELIVDGVHQIPTTDFTVTIGETTSTIHLLDWQLFAGQKVLMYLGLTE